MALSLYPGRLGRLLTTFSQTVQRDCPDAQMRLTYRPFDNLDVQIEIDLPGVPQAATMTTVGEGLGIILAEGYTVRALVRGAAGPFPVRAGHPGWAAATCN
jgi:hypothetical protein